MLGPDDLHRQNLPLVQILNAAYRLTVFRFLGHECMRIAHRTCLGRSTLVALTGILGYPGITGGF